MSEDKYFDRSQYEFEHARIRVYLIYLGFDRDIAFEVASDATSEAWEKKVPDKYRLPWMRKLAYRAAVRKSRRDPLANIISKGYVPPNFQLDGTEEYRELELREVMIRAIQQLPPRQRVAMALHLDNRSPREISDEMKVSLRSVYSLLKYARANLKPFVDEGEEQEGA